MPSVFCQSATSRKPIQIYMDVGVSLLRFKYPAVLKKTFLEMQKYELHFPKLHFRAKYIFFHIQKRNNFVAVVTLLNLYYTFRFSFFPIFSVFLGSFAVWRISIIFQRIHHETFWVLYRELVLMNVSETVCRIVLVLLWFPVIDKTIRNTWFSQ